MDKLSTVLLLLTLCSAVLTIPLSEEFQSSKQATIVKYENENDGTGNYKFSFETSDGIRRDETGILVNQGQSNEYISVIGSYSYTRPDGVYEEINYIADLNGYQLFKKQVIVQGTRSCFFVVIFFANVVFNWPTSLGLENSSRNRIFNNNGLGQYSFEFQTSDGTYRKEDGGLLPNIQGLNRFAVRGEYRYKDPKGYYHSLKYIADHNGFQPVNNDDYRFNDRNIVLHLLIKQSYGVIYTYEDVELRRIFPSEFPQDTIRKSGVLHPEHLGRYSELKNYFRNPKSNVNSHFEELACFEESGKKVCRIDLDRYSPEEDQYYLSTTNESHVDRRRVYCIMLLCFTEDEIDRVVASFDM